MKTKMAMVFSLLLVCFTAFAQTNQTVDCRIRDATSATSRAAVSAATGSTFTVSVVALTVKAANYFYNGSAWAPMIPPWGTVVDSYVAGEVGLNVATQNFAISNPGKWHCMTAQGGSACVTCGAANPPTTNMTTDCTFYIAESSTRCEILTGPNCGVISYSTVAGGYLRFTYKQ